MNCTEEFFFSRSPLDLSIVPEPVFFLPICKPWGCHCTEICFSSPWLLQSPLYPVCFWYAAPMELRFMIKLNEIFVCHLPHFFSLSYHFRIFWLVSSLFHSCTFSFVFLFMFSFIRSCFHHIKSKLKENNKITENWKIQPEIQRKIKETDEVSKPWHCTGCFFSSPTLGANVL